VSIFWQIVVTLISSSSWNGLVTCFASIGHQLLLLLANLDPQPPAPPRPVPEHRHGVRGSSEVLPPLFRAKLLILWLLMNLMAVCSSILSLLVLNQQGYCHLQWATLPVDRQI